MSDITPLKNIIVAGATGSVGAPILKALLEEPSLNVSILSRASSKAQFPVSIPLKKVSDEFTVEELTEAFRGQDAVVVALSTTPITQDNLAIRLIEGAIAAGVKRFIPSEFGTNNLDPRARKVVPIYDTKGAAHEFLEKRCKESGMTWTSFACGSWLDWALNPAQSGNFLGIDVKNKRATIWDSGNSRFAITTSHNTGLAVVRSLLHPNLTANKQIFLADFHTTSASIVAELECQTGSKFIIEHRDSTADLTDARQKFDAGDYAAAFTLLAVSFTADVDVGYDFEAEQEIWNKKLGLPEVSLEQVIKDAVELANRG
ncbi:NAD(P)-binding protein [Delitschia confertaspora ATCC 74209]|uniref:NAD(P)-binding protein n=1 Tax=Delitschia confertaspora ATCC 74209 TaxID=1513339 RepID=A0A9P4JQS4_9PLEO|nr:NAD(P)-binding protein [Delitschia confertaspora ATCC 74209]